MENECGIFCEIYGNTIRNRVVEYLLENRGLDFAASTLSKELSISRPKAYGIINELLLKAYIQKSRIVGRTQLYRLDTKHRIIRLMAGNFDECLRLAAESAIPEPVRGRYASRVTAIAAKERKER